MNIEELKKENEELKKQVMGIVDYTNEKLKELKKEYEDKITFLGEEREEWKNRDPRNFLKRMNKEKNMGWDA